MTLTDPQRKNLISLRDTGKPSPSRAAYNCRELGLSEFVWEMSDGSVATSAEIKAMPKPLLRERCCVRVVREQLTDAGRKALAESK